MDREEIRLRLRNEYTELDRRIGELRASVESAEGSVKLYRQRRLSKALEDRARLSNRLRMITHEGGSKRWTEAEKLWSDLRNAVLGLASVR
jgi:hypothetical protein